MKTIGLIGGMSWESTALYYRWINEDVKARLGGLHSARVLLHSVDFDDIVTLQREGRWDAAGALLAKAAHGLERAGADMLLVCTNTMHQVAAQIEAAVRIPLLHIADATGRQVVAAGITRVALLGTRFTMEQSFYVDRLRERFGLEVMLPDADERAELHRVIFDELCLGDVRTDSRRLYRAVIDRLAAQGAQGVILGCTEITMLLNAAQVTTLPIPAFDTTRLHARCAVDAAMDIVEIAHDREPAAALA